MASPLIATKLFVPQPRPGRLERPRLRERLNRGADAKLTLISAPAGFGKTALLAEWLADRSAAGRAVAWLSLDQADNDPAAFWSHLIAALQVAATAEGAGFLPAHQPGQHTNDVVLAQLLNELSGFPKIVDLVLDDYHLVEHQEVQAGMASLLDHLPAHIHIVIATRADPALPLARLRARAELVEIRSTDLRFTGEEAAAYLQGVPGLGLAPADVATLGQRTEGWIAALQLAALSMQGRDDLPAFIAGFAGNDRYIFDYLVEEVLERQSEPIRRFLLATCFLSRLGGALCDAVTGELGSKAMLDALHRQNLFVVPLDDQRQWYRYHHLFADVLLTQLDDAARQALPLLHLRASDWYARHGEPAEAIRHALAGNGFERAAELIELAIPEMQRTRGEAVIRGWLRALPDDLVRRRPVLGIGFVGALASIGDFTQVEDRLRDVERGLAALADPGTPAGRADDVVVVDASQLARVPAAIELYRAALSQMRGDVPGLIGHARRAFDLAPLDDHLARAAASGLLGIAYWSGGDLDAARSFWLHARDGLQRSGNIADVLGVSMALADIHLVLGHLRDATEVYRHALSVAAGEPGPVLRGTPDMHAGLAELHRERNELDLTRHHLQACRDLGEPAGLPQHPYRWRVVAAHLRRDEGDLTGAAVLLDDAVRLYVSDFFPNVRPVTAIRARLWIAQGRLDEASRWQRDSGLAADDALSYLREFEHIVLARLLLARQPGDPVALGLLDRLLQAAEAGQRLGSVIELSILKALASRHGDGAAALPPLERALTLAAPEGYVRLFANEGEPMSALLKLAVKRRIAPLYARQLLAAIGQPAAVSQAHPDLVEPLSDRELDVLRLLRSDLGGPEIARQLMVSENTMRTHTKNIYEKLGVNSRRSAVRRAEELDLLARPKSR